MGAETKIQWADHTWSPWIGCTKVSEGCRNCYAAERDHRWGGDHWGPGKPRQVTSPAYWKQPLKWNAEARERMVRESVFPSLCDPFDAEAPEGALDWLWALIRATPQLDWLLLTKRPDRAARLFPWASAAEAAGVESAGAGGAPWENVWIIASVEDQDAADRRIPDLLRLRVAHRGLSCEPLLGPVRLGELALRGAFLRCEGETDDPATDECNGCPGYTGPGGDYCGAVRGPRVDWVIVGGESGAGARPMRLEWARSIVQQCKAVGVPVFCKQLGAKPFEKCSDCTCVDAEVRYSRWPADCRSAFPLKLDRAHGGDPAEWPEDLRVRQFPQERR